MAPCLILTCLVSVRASERELQLPASAAWRLSRVCSGGGVGGEGQPPHAPPLPHLLSGHPSHPQLLEGTLPAIQALEVSLPRQLLCNYLYSFSLFSPVLTV